MKNPVPHFLLGVLALAQWAGAFTPSSVPVEKIANHYDVVIAGAGTGGCGAAIQAARMGAKVLLMDETDYIGGQMNAAAVTSMDEGGTAVRERGLYKELVERIEAHYEPLKIDPETAYWYGHICLEPRVGRKILHEMLAEEKGIDLSLRSQVLKVAKNGNLVTGADIEVVTENGKATKTVTCAILVDATEWGDVLPLAGVPYRSGNTISGAVNLKQKIQDITWTAVAKQYPDGVPEELKFKQAPPGYTAKMEEYFKATLMDGDTMGEPGRARPWTWFKFIGYRGMPDSTRPQQPQTITRTHLNFNNDYRASAGDIEDKTQRLETERGAILKTLQLLYYIQTTLGKSDWAVANDEGYDTPYNRVQVDAMIKANPDLEPFHPMLEHFPVMAYARESRRMIGEYTLKARDIERVKSKPVLFPDCIAVGDYAVDLHGSMVPKYLELDLDREEDIPQHGAFTTGPFAIPYRSLIPEKTDGFLPAEKNFSQSKMANGATRLQPHTMLVGQAVGATAALSVKLGVQPRKLDPAVVQAALLDDGDILFYPTIKDMWAESPEWKAIQLATTHGMLLPEDGMFYPQEPVTSDQFQKIRETLGGKSVAHPKQNVSRKSIAEFLAEAGESEKVKVDFPGDEAKPITRSEAAQVIAEYLELRGLARTTGNPVTLKWNSVRPASERVLAGSLALRKSLRRLVEEGIVTTDKFWLENAREGDECDGALVAVVMKRAADKMSPGDTRHPAEILVEKHVMTSVDYWKAHAVEGGACDGRNVSFLLRGIAKNLPR